MAPLVCFSHLTNIFFSISPDEYYPGWIEEIWGCVKYIGIPYETVMNMPVQKRKTWIMRHNMEQEIQKEEAEKAKNGNTSMIDGLGINAYAQMEQNKQKMNGDQLK